MSGEGNDYQMKQFVPRRLSSSSRFGPTLIWSFSAWASSSAPSQTCFSS